MLLYKIYNNYYFTHFNDIGPDELYFYISQVSIFKMATPYETNQEFWDFSNFSVVFGSVKGLDTSLEYYGM